MKIMSEKRIREEVERKMQEEQRFERLRLEIDDRFRNVYIEIDRLRMRVSELEREKHPAPTCKEEATVLSH